MSDWNGKDGDTLRRMWKEGKSSSEIAAVLNVAPVTVRKRARMMDLPYRQGPGQKRGKYKMSKNTYYGFSKGQVMPADTTEVGRAKQALQRRGYVVYDAEVIGGGEGKIVVDNAFLTPSQVIRKAAQL